MQNIYLFRFSFTTVLTFNLTGLDLITAASKNSVMHNYLIAVHSTLLTPFYIYLNLLLIKTSDSKSARRLKNEMWKNRAGGSESQGFVNGVVHELAFY